MSKITINSKSGLLVHQEMGKWGFRDKITQNRELTNISIITLISQLIYGVFWIFLANLITTENYGELSFFVSIGTIITAVCLIGSQQSLMVFPSKGIKIHGLVVLSILISIIASILVFIFLNISVSIFILGTVIFALITSELLGLKLYNKFSKNIFVQRILSIVFAISLYYLIGFEGILLGLGLSYLVFTKRIFQILKSTKIDYSVLTSKKQFILSAYGVDLSKILAFQADKIFIFPIFGAAILGHYFLGMQILALGIAVPGAIFQFLLPKESGGENVTKTKIMNVLLSTVLAGLGIILTPILFPILFPNYVDSIFMIQIMIVSLIPTTINLMYISHFYSKENSKIILFASIISISLQIPLILILGNMWGGVGLAISLVLAYSGESVFLFVSNRIFKNNYSDNKLH